MSLFLATLPTLGVMRAESLFACAACYGQSDSPLAQGMNWGIATLLAVIGCVLGGVAAFFVHLGRRSASASPTDTAAGGPLAKKV